MLRSNATRQVQPIEVIATTFEIATYKATNPAKQN